jgi:hypothetical protein
VKREKTIVIPDGDEPAKKPAPQEPFVVFAGDSDERDVSKPIGYDANGNPLYAPRGIQVQLRWR